MSPLKKKLLRLGLLGLLIFSLSACNDDDDDKRTQHDDILDLIVRTVPDEAIWANALNDLMQDIEQEEGFIGIQEFKSIFSALPTDPDTGQGIQNVYFGFNQYDNQAIYEELAASYMENPPASFLNYLPTNEGLLNIQVQPYRETPALDVANMVQDGQVLEIAVRDTSLFNFADFDVLRKDFVDLLLQQEGVVREFEYRSTDQRYYVGMTLYASMEDFQRVVSNPAVAQSDEFTQLLTLYPPLYSQFGVLFDYAPAPAAKPAQ